MNIGVGVCLIVVREKKLLVAERINSFGKGYLSFPGGHQEQNETWERTALRELSEEAGSNIKVIIKYNSNFSRSESHVPLFVTNNVLNNKLHYVTIWLRSEWAAGDPINAEPSKKKDWQWLTLDELTDDIRMKIGKEAWLSGEFDDSLHWVPLSELHKFKALLGI